MTDNLIGKVGVCSIGEVGLIQDYVQLPWGWSWVGIKLTDGSSWASRSPIIVADSLEEYERNHK